MVQAQAPFVFVVAVIHCDYASYSINSELRTQAMTGANIMPRTEGCKLMLDL